ncbi:MAG: hypothetical protein DYG89_32140 [Caldilinea sp. CFX5]|nr:hypothetical protein [Caldilinea sp. CFX5]
MPDMILKALNRLEQAEIAALLTPREGPCLSFFLPTSPAAGHTIAAEPLMLRNLLDQATTQLAAQGMALSSIEQLLAPLTAIANSGELWRYQQKGLAFFVAPHVCLGYRLPLALPACVVVDHSFYIKPLLPIIDGEDHFYLLALSQNAVRFFHGDRYQMTAMALPETPTSLAEALQYDEFERTLQLHSASSGAGQGRQPAIFHGQGVAGDETIVHANLLRFFHSVERTVTSRLTRTHAPLVLAGVDADQGLYRQVNHYPHLLPQGIPGNYDRATATALHELAWAIVAPYFAQAREHALARYRQLAGQGDGHTVTEIKNVVLAAVYHQVDTLFATPTGAIWGKFIPEGHQVVVHKENEPGDEELTNLAVIHTLQNHGTAYLLAPETMPEPTAVAAILRH